MQTSNPQRAFDSSGRRPKRRQMDRVQWEVMRERCRLNNVEAPCEGSARLIADDVMEIVRTKLESPDVRLRSRVVAEWHAAVGPVIAAHAFPGSLRQGVLTVDVDSSVWLNEISRMHSRAMLAGLQQRLGPNVVMRLVFKVDAAAVKSGAPTESRTPLPRMKTWCPNR